MRIVSFKVELDRFQNILVAGLFRQDWNLIARSVEDRIAEPLRAALVPGFAEVKEAALQGGALAASLSGSGPSVSSPMWQILVRRKEGGSSLFVRGHLLNDNLGGPGNTWNKRRVETVRKQPW